jgi:hypothetical protein
MCLAVGRFRAGVGLLSVAKLTVGQEAYYEQQVAGGLDDYYAGRGESPGIWAGRGAELLGLDGMEERADLTGEQRALVREACMSRDRVVCAVGVPGSGKTTALRVLGAAYRNAGIPVLGAAPSGRAADELATATGIRSTTMHRLLLDARLEGGLPRGCLVVVDEAGMAETRTLGPLLRLVDAAGGKAILVGDPGQLPAVGAGGLFPALCDRVGAIGLSENRRQQDPAERDALARLRIGNPEPYLAHAAASGRLRLEDEATSAKRRLLEDWWPVAEHDPGGTVMLAYRRDDVRELNDAARKLMLRAGRRRNDARCDIRNGTCGTVVDLDLAGRALMLRTDAGALRRINSLYALEHLDDAYALTGHAAQGATADRAFVLLRDEGALREWGYVACSRARTETRLYGTGESLEGEQHGHVPIQPHAWQARWSDQAPSNSHPRGRSQTRATSRDEPKNAADVSASTLKTAEQRLTSAQQQLRNISRLGHRRQRAELRAEVAHQQTVVRLARTQLTEPPLKRPKRRPTRAPRTCLEPEPRARTQTHECDLGLER